MAFFSKNPIYYHFSINPFRNVYLYNSLLPLSHVYSYENIYLRFFVYCAKIEKAGFFCGYLMV
ncbi:protein of unknown function [Serratia sp. Tan611]|nr:protein of unknown function [Serratia sp. Tan611]